MDGWMDGQIDTWMDKRTDGMDRWINKQCIELTSRPYHHSLHLIPLINNIYDYSVLKRERRRKAVLILTHLFQMHSKKTSFSAWITDTTESKKAKVFFQVLLLVTCFKFDQTFTFRPF